MRVLVALVLLAALALLFLPGCAQERKPLAPPPSGVGRIGFVSSHEGDYEIYVVNSDGSGLGNLTQNIADDGDPSWSADGRSVLFVSNRDGVPEVYVMQSSGSGVRRLTDEYSQKTSPRWSPRGDAIAFLTQASGSTLRIMNGDGGAATDLDQEEVDGFAWSPDGSLLAYFADGKLYAVRPDGSGLTVLADTGEGVGLIPAAAWSPDGRKLAFGTAVTVEGGLGSLPEIWVVNADGTGLTNVTENAATDFMPAWSPDGKHIAFVSDRDDDLGDVYVMDADGSNVKRLTRQYGGDLLPAWSTDGTQLAFVSDRDGHAEVYVMNADGSGQVRLTTDIVLRSVPVWVP